MTALGPQDGGEPPPPALAAGLALVGTALLVGLEGLAALAVYREVWQQACGAVALCVAWWLGLQGIKRLREAWQ